MATGSNAPNVIILGAGPSGIATAHKLKSDLGFDDFLIYEKLSGVGGTWMSNQYPGCGCDIPSHLYSFSFNLNPGWSQDLVNQKEILQYMNNTVDKFGLREHIQLETECIGARWDINTREWDVHFRDVKTGHEFQRRATILISAVGAISYPKKVNFKGLENFKGKVFHTAEWDQEYNYIGKRMAVIGNGCSAAQVIPSVVHDVSYLKQYARGAQWYHERPNRVFSPAHMWAFRNIPLYNRWYRFQLFVINDSLAGLYNSTKSSIKARKAVENEAKDYIYRHTPTKYHSFIAPDFPLGCKRRIWDPGYLNALWEKNLDLVPEGIQEFHEGGIISESGHEDYFDVVVMATGFHVTDFLVPMDIIGANGTNLREQWKDTRGAQAYYGCYVNGFPNFAMLFGPNTFPAHNSALFAIESGIEFVAKTLLVPILDRKVGFVDVKCSAENRFANRIREKLDRSVYEAGCSNWYVNEHGKNVTSWPGYAVSFYFETLFPHYEDFHTGPASSRWWLLHRLRRWIRTKTCFRVLLAVVAALGFYRLAPATWKNRIALARMGSIFAATLPLVNSKR